MAVINLRVINYQQSQHVYECSVSLCASPELPLVQFSCPLLRLHRHSLLLHLTLIIPFDLASSLHLQHNLLAAVLVD